MSPRAADYASKLAMMLRHMTFEREAAYTKLLEAVCAALLDHLDQRVRLGLPVRMVNGTPLVEPYLRDAAFVLGATWELPRMERFAQPDKLAGYAFRTAEWLRPVLEAHGLAWRWARAEERQVA
ncbi:MAG: hypothetical protein HY060_13725 [Proteobacteria bacterium]|nr:hypothetical protein [Pseudomonadota bacterium]